MRLMLATGLVALLIFAQTAETCTTFGVGKSASNDGSVFSTHSNDGSGNTDPRLVKVPARDFPEGATRPIYESPEGYPRYVGTERAAPVYYPGNCQEVAAKCEPFKAMGSIPQVRHTYAYFEQTYGAMNEKQVGISESTCSGVFAAKSITNGGKALLSVDQLSQIAMERAATAQEAIKIMGSLAEEFGFYGESSSFEGGSESLIVTDPNEAWVFHVLADATGTSAYWGAARVPDDSVAVVANMFSIRTMDMKDTANFLGSTNLWQNAERDGLYNPSARDFTATFSDGEYAHKYYSGRRMWGVFRLLAPAANLPAVYGNLKFDRPYPFAVRVEAKLTPQDVMSVMRDWYNGTEYSTGEGSGVSGGAWGTPDRYGNNALDGNVQGNWERTIALYRSSDTQVLQSRAWLPDAIGGVIWFGAAAAHGTAYIPVLAGMTRSPAVLQGWQGVYDTSTAFWANRRVLNTAQVKFSYMLQNVRQVQGALEGASVALTQHVEEFVKTAQRQVQWGLSASAVPDAYALSASALTAAQLEAVTLLFEENAVQNVLGMNQLFHFLQFTYADGDANYWSESGFHSSSLGYPVWWLEAGNYASGPPPVDEAGVGPMKFSLPMTAMRRSFLEAAAKASTPGEANRAVRELDAAAGVGSGVGMGAGVREVVPGGAAAGQRDSLTQRAQVNAVEQTAAVLGQCLEQCEQQSHSCYDHCAQRFLACVRETGLGQCLDLGLSPTEKW
ncbi:peptidase family C69-domain-containing protein [Ochromonadaceae sp. CCMP2298]|nr:peptidase family C69-domain-containing protein [Ochromonadaceae sp. CCMP2298]